MGWRGLGLGLAVLLAAPGAADVASRSDLGFAVAGSDTVVATPEQTWRSLVAPSQWWSKTHTWSGDSANLRLEAWPGGCFCEVLPAGKGTARGAVEHMRIVYVRPGKMLRMKGALGPLQAEAVEGTLTVTLERVSGGTRIEWSYAVGGYMRFKPEEIARGVDQVLSEQFASLVTRLGRYRPG